MSSFDRNKLFLHSLLIDRMKYNGFVLVIMMSFTCFATFIEIIFIVIIVTLHLELGSG